jgi:hypothetical protein
MLRKPKVVRKFVELFGEGIPAFSITKCATVRKYNSESSATIRFSNEDEETLTNLQGTGRTIKTLQYLRITIIPRVFVGISRKSEIAQGSFPLAQGSFPASLAIITLYDPSNDAVFIGGAMLVDRR